MPIETIEQQQAAYGPTPSPSTTSTGGVPTPTLPPPPMGPPLPTPLNAGIPLVKGRARLQQLINENRGLFSSGMWGHDFNKWILSLAPVMDDPEFNAALQQMQGLALRYQSGDTPTNIGPPGSPGTSKGSQDFSIMQVSTSPNLPLQTGTQGTTDGGTGAIPTDPNLPTVGTGGILDEEKVRERKARAKAQLEGTPLFKGAPVPGSVVSEQGEIEDPYLRQFFNKHGITLDSDDAQKKLDSGEWVYMGTEVDSTGTKRPVYVYKDQAHNAVVNLPAKKIAAYQKALGLNVTGRPDPYIEQYWDAAVASAQRYAAAGHKVSVQELFDMYINSAIAKRNASGGGGGGGGAGAQAPSTDDYYMAMMGVLGDISGVEG